MQLTLSFPDSEVAGIDVDADGLVVRFAAASVRRHDVPAGPVDGYSQGVRLRVQAPGESARAVAQTGDLFGRLSTGRLLLGDAPVRHLTLPSRHAGAVTLELAFAHGTRVALAGSGWSLAFAGPPNHRDALAC